jgi:hypothetical protein
MKRHLITVLIALTSLLSITCGGDGRQDTPTEPNEPMSYIIGSAVKGSWRGPRSDSSFLTMRAQGSNYVDYEPMTPGFQLLPAADLNGSQRIVDGDGDGNAFVDMGPYEYQRE